MTCSSLPIVDQRCHSVGRRCHAVLRVRTDTLKVQKARWVLTGTPLQNSPKEMFSYLHFLRYEPFCELAAFRRVFKAGSLVEVSARLREILRPIMLRRTKATTIEGTRIVQLPERCVSPTAAGLRTLLLIPQASDPDGIKP